MANIPFNVIEKSWFIDLIRTLKPGYDVPSRQILGGSLLEAELSRVGMRINRELERETDFTIGKFLSFFVLIIIHIIYFHFIYFIFSIRRIDGSSRKKSLVIYLDSSFKKRVSIASRRSFKESIYIILFS